MQKNDDRSANIELIRILSMLGIIIMHSLNPHMFGLLSWIAAQRNWWAIAITYYIVSFFACAVNLFILISGYFMCQTYHRKMVKPIKLLMQVIIFRIVDYLLGVIIGSHDLTVHGLIISLIPVNYYVILYIALYWISPYINIVIDALNHNELKKCIFLLLSIFSVYPTLVDFAQEIAGNEINGLSSVGMYGSQWGYSIVNFILMYIIGAYIRKVLIYKAHSEGGGLCAL